MESKTTPVQRLATILLGDEGPLEPWVRSRRGQGLSWRTIARQLYDATNGEIDVAVETLRGWFPDPEQAAS